MNNSYYKTGKFKNYNIYEALAVGQKNKKFSSFELPELDQFDFSQLDVKEITNKKPSYWIKQKLAYLHETQQCRLHYSGGNDSHTLLKTAEELGIAFDQIFIYLTSPDQDLRDDWEFAPGIKYLAQNSKTYKDLYIEKYTIEDYELWYDSETPFKIDGFYHGFRPAWGEVFMRNINDNMLNILGTELPNFYFKNGISYLVLLDNYFYIPGTNHTDFFLDTIFPETTISQVYSSLEFIKQAVGPEYNGWMDYRTLSDLKQMEHNKSVGRTAPADEFLKVTKTKEIWENFGWLNKKHQKALQKIIKLGRLDIVDAWISTSNKLAERLGKNQNIEIQTVSLQNFADTKHESIQLVHPINRIGAIFRCDPDKLVKLDHKDINLLD